MTNNVVPASSAGAVGIAVAAVQLTDPSTWWRDIDESPTWQNRIFYTLAILYGVVSAIALVPCYPIQSSLFLPSPFVTHFFVQFRVL
jgi:hypothetical protein